MKVLAAMRYYCFGRLAVATPLASRRRSMDQRRDLLTSRCSHRVGERIRIEIAVLGSTNDMTDFGSSAHPGDERTRLDALQSEIHFAQQCIQAAGRDLARGNLTRAKELLDVAARSHDAALEQLLGPTEDDERDLITLARALGEDLRGLREQIQRTLRS